MFFCIAEDLNTLSLSQRTEEVEVEVLDFALPRQVEQQLAIMAGQQGKVKVDCHDDLREDDFVFDFDIFTDKEEAYNTDN